PLAGDPLGVAAARCHLAVQRHRRLEQDPGPAGARVLSEWLVQQSRSRGKLAVGDHDLHPFVSQDPETTAGRVLAGILGADDNSVDPRLADRIGAGWGPAVVAARLERHIERRALEVLA